MHFEVLLMWILLIDLSNIPMDQSCQKMHIVPRCPRNMEEWNARAKSLNCTSTPKNDVYHCALKESGTELIELCAPPRNIQGHSCTEFNSLGRLIQESFIKCGNDFVSCPYLYLSTEAYKYQSCYDKVKDKAIVPHPDSRSEISSENNVALFIAIVFFCTFCAGVGIVLFKLYREVRKLRKSTQRNDPSSKELEVSLTSA